MKVFYPKRKIYVDLPEQKIASSLDGVNLNTKLDGSWNDPKVRVVDKFEILFEAIKPKTNKELYAELNKILDLAKRALTEAEKFAEKHQLVFSFGAPGAPEVNYHPHSTKIRSQYSDNMEENHMITDGLEEDEKIEPLTEHRSDVYYAYDYDQPFKGGWWVPSQFC